MTLRVALEIGHGYRILKDRKVFDPGALGVAGVGEYKTCYMIGSIAQRILRDNLILADMIYSHTTLLGRGQAGRDYDVFVSIHLNASELHRAQGTEVFVLPEHTSSDALLATSLQNALVKKLRLRDRGVKEKRLTVLVGANGCPARCLAESFFIDACDTADEIDALALMAGEAIAKGIMDYFQGGIH